MGASPNEDKLYFTPVEAADLLMVAPVTVRAWAAKGLIAAQVTAGGHRRFLRRDLELFAHSRGINLLDSSAARRTDLRVLIVDDDAGFAQPLREFLAAHGVAVDASSDGFAAGRQVESFKPDVILLDIMMPGLNGFEVCQNIKASAHTRHVRVLAMTAYPSEDNLAAIHAAGAETCLTKPFHLNHLLDMLGVARRLGNPGP
ncbi:MAG: response regulator [Gammaproteobacteria bacterium]|nr:response regulator [Gammaproteobacteria bacterium]